MSLVGSFASQQYHGNSMSHHSDFISYPHPRNPYSCGEPTLGSVPNTHDSGLSMGGSSGNMGNGTGYFHPSTSGWMLNSVAHESSLNTVDTYGFSTPDGMNCPDYTGSSAAMFGMSVDHTGTVYVTRNGHRSVKRRGSANRKERRRTLSINTAFSNLRGCIPNVPTDTKLSKIKTLRLATSYIGYLMDVLNEDDPTLVQVGFKAELTKKVDREEKKRREAVSLLYRGWGGGGLLYI